MLILRFYFDTSKGQMAQTVLVNTGDKKNKYIKKRLIIKTVILKKTLHTSR